MAMFKNGNSVSGIRSVEKKSVEKKRALLRQILLETLERRELMAIDSAGVIFAPGTSQEYMDTWIDFYKQGSAGTGEPGDNSGNFDAGSNGRWINPVGGISPNVGDPATVTWSIVPDGTLVGQNQGPSNFIAFMDGIYGSGTGPVASRPWFPLVQRAYDNWAKVSGLTFVYESFDDGAPQGGTNRGIQGVRGDMRIGGVNIDGDFGTLAYNYFPNSGGIGGFDGDMVVDTNDSFFRINADGASGENRALINTLTHEAGHGIGLGHVDPRNNTKLMETQYSGAFYGPQHDDILGAQTLYGDDDESNDSAATATSLGTIRNGLRTRTLLSMDNNADRDFFSIDAPSAGRLTLSVTPVGFQYSVAPTGGSVGPVDSLRYSDLSFQLLGSDGQTVLAQVNNGGLGVAEILTDFEIRTPGQYFIRVDGSSNIVQLYSLGIAGSGFRSTDADVRAPQLISVNPNAGSIFSFVDPNLNRLSVSPRELIFRFDGAQQLDPATLGSIRITRSGDGVFGNGNDVVIQPGFLGFGDTNRIVIARFKDALPNDRYRIEIFGYDDPDRGVIGLRNLDGILLEPRVPGTDRDTIDFRLELGAQIVSVVPQPVRKVGNLWVQDSNTIEVYFNDDDLWPVPVTSTGAPTDPAVVNRDFYQLLLTQNTVRNTDDVRFTPTSVSYSPVDNKVTLTFDNSNTVSNPFNYSLYNGAAFRLRIGTSEAIPVAPTSIDLFAADPADTFNNASNLGLVNSFQSLLVNSEIVNPTIYNLDFPGAPDSPGVREINATPGDTDFTNINHLRDDLPDVDSTIRVQRYNFLKTQPYGTSSQGTLLFSSISPLQEQRVREVLSFYAQYLGIKFVETDAPTGADDWTIVVGDLIPLGSNSFEGGTLGLAGFQDPGMRSNHTFGRQTVILDRAETWNDAFGASDNIKPSFFVVAMREIGNLLGLGQMSDLPPGTIMGGNYSNLTLGGEPRLLGTNPTEPIFPGDQDIIAGRYLHRPDSRDVDMYRFEIAPGQAGLFTAEIVAERSTDGSLLDSYLTLYREKVDPITLEIVREVIAVNDDYYSQDSFLQLDLSAGVYFLGVSASGNSNYNPDVNDSGMNGTSEGRYSIRTTFRPLVNRQIVDIDNTALDGDLDGVAGGVYSFWFRAAQPLTNSASPEVRTIFVDKSHVQNTAPGAPALGSLANPFNKISSALSVARQGDIVRILGNAGLDGNPLTLADSYAYEIGTGGPLNQPLSDGATMNVPRGVTVMVDAGAVFKLRGSSINVGSTTSSVDRSRGNLQILGKPGQNVIFTSYQDESIGIDTNPITTLPTAGDWGGIEFKNDIDQAEGRFSFEREGIFLDYINHADIRFGGGQVSLDSQNRVITPIQMTKARPTITYNSISRSSDAAISADPDSFEETTFNTSLFQLNGTFTPDYTRVGPMVRKNLLSNNSTNGLFIRVDTLAGNATTQQTVAGRWDDTDITHVIGQNLVLAGTAGGPKLESSRPAINTATLSGVRVTGGLLAPPVGGSVSYRYRLVYVDAQGGETLASNTTQSVTLTHTTPSTTFNAVQLTLPTAPSGFVARRLYRQTGTTGNFELVAELNRSSSIYVDRGGTLGNVLVDRPELNRPRLDASLIIDPGIVVKSDGARIEAGIGATLIAEGRDGIPVVFTSRRDDRYGASGTFDTNNDGTTNPNAGDWGGLYFGHLSKGSIDHSLITFAGGITSISGNFAGFNATEIHQADVRISNAVYEQNASGFGAQSTSNRDGHGFNEAAVIFVRGAQPVIIDNIFRNNPIPNTPVISINANALTTDSVLDGGRQRGFSDRLTEVVDNLGPMIYGNFVGDNSINGMDVRGQTLTTATVWDDTDIVHVLRDEILVPDLNVMGGIQLKSRPTESLVVKLSANAGFTATGRPLEIDDRIGGIVQIVGSPGFPVYLTSLRDDSIGAGFDPKGLAQNDTNGDGDSTGSAGDWRSIRLDKFSHDRNVETIVEQESPRVTAPGTNAVPSNAQQLGALAAAEDEGDENLRLGFTVQGVINEKSDIDVYSFKGSAGTEVWIDIDRTTNALDTVVELINGNGEIIALSDNSYDEALGSYSIYKNPELIPLDQANSLPRDAFFPKNGNGTTTDFYSTNPFDAGFRVVLPGVLGEENTYFVRVRSSNIDSLDTTANRDDLTDPAKLRDGKTTGRYQLQVRLREMDEWGGSSVRYADIRYATTGIEVFGMPAHSPLIGEANEPLQAGVDTNNTVGGAVNLGNFANTDRAVLSVAGEIATATDVDWYRFDINIDSIQGSGLAQHLATIIDIDYADGQSRPNTSFWLYYNTPNGVQLVAAGTDSNIADDRPAPLNGTDLDDLSRGSVGFLDAYLGSTELVAGTYFLAVTNNSQIPTDLRQFQEGNPSNPLARLEPVNSIHKIVEDRFNRSPQTTAFGALQVAFTGNANAIDYTLGDVVLFVTRPTPGGTTSDLVTVDSLTGAAETAIRSFPRVFDIAMRPDGNLYGYEIPVTVPSTDNNNGNYIQIDTAGNGTNRVAGNSNIDTFTQNNNNPPDNAKVATNPDTTGDDGVGIQFRAITYTTGTGLGLYGAGSRGYEQLTWTALTNNQQNSRNFIYQMNPVTGAALSSPAADRVDAGRAAAGTAQVNTAGTQIRERGWVNTTVEINPQPPRVLYTSPARTLTSSGNIIDGDIISVNGRDYEFDLGDSEPGIRLNITPPGLVPTDGNTFTLTVGPTVFTFEFDTGPVIRVTAGGSAALEGQTIVIRDAFGVSHTFEFSADATLAAPGAIRIPYRTDDSSNNIVNQIINSINGAGLTIAAEVLPGTQRITITGDTQLTAATAATTVAGAYGVTAGSTAILVEETWDNAEVAAAIANVLDGTHPSGIVAVVNGNELTFTGADSGFFDTTPWIIALSTGISVRPGNIPIPFSVDFSAEEIAQTVFTSLSTIIPGVVWTGNSVSLPAGFSYDTTRTFFQRATAASRISPLMLDFVPTPAPVILPTLKWYVTGIAMVGSEMFAVTESGDLFEVGLLNSVTGDVAFSAASTGNRGDYIASIIDPATGAPVQFSGLTVGPRNVEGGRFSNVLFGIASNGDIYAFDTRGRLVPAFANGKSKISTGVGGANGLAFSNLDVNLWHVSSRRGTDAGHGVEGIFDGSRESDSPGSNSLYFGFEGAANPGNWDGVWDLGNTGVASDYNPARYNTYEFPGGAQGSIESNPLDLSNYSAEDKPMLYFNYRLATENANSDLNDTTVMRDSFRVFAAGEDGQWHLLATNNSMFDNERVQNADDEKDYFLNGTDLQIQELYDVSDTNNGTRAPAADSWRQARIDLRDMAGKSNVRLRFDFSTAGSMGLGSIGTGGEELRIVEGNQLADGDTFTIRRTVAGVPVDSIFEFDFGVTFNAPSGANILEGSTFQVDGTTFRFTATPAVPTDIQIGVNVNSGTIASRMAAALNNNGFTVTVDPVNLTRLSVPNALTATQSVSLPANFIDGLPGVDAGNLPVFVTYDMSAIQVRDAIRTALALHYNELSEKSNLSTFRVENEILRLNELRVVDSGKLGLSRRAGNPNSTNRLAGDSFGGFTSSLRGQNNRNEGVFIDDIIVGFAERGEIVSNGTFGGTSFATNLQYEPQANTMAGERKDEVELGRYQLEIRRSASFGISGGTSLSLDPMAGARAFDTNERLVQGFSLVARPGSQIADGQIFTISDGVNTLRYEFNDTTIVDPAPGAGFTQGNIEVPYTPTMTTAEIARAIRDAINSADSQAVIKVVAGLSDSRNESAPSGSIFINLYGAAAADNNATNDFGDIDWVVSGIDTFDKEDVGDSNRKRDQGQIILHSNIIRDSSSFGIIIDAAARTSPLTPLAGVLPRSGPVRNLPQFNLEGWVPGVVAANNVLALNRGGGILFSGDTQTGNTMDGSVPFGRLVNNTIVGLRASDVGISVTNNASPTILNNIVTNLGTGIRVDSSSSSTVIGYTIYQNNQIPVQGTGTGAQAILLQPTEPLFVNASQYNFYPAPLSKTIDSSIDVLEDRPALVSVKDNIGLPLSPILAPSRDITGQLRVDDPAVTTPSGQGGNVFKDRGAYDRADFVNPIAQLLVAQDNDNEGRDIDPNLTYVQLLEGTLDHFSILLLEDNGTGPDVSTVSKLSVSILEDGRLLKEGVDYTFGFNVTNRTIRLTPLSGIWRPGSAYEITLNNRNRFMLTSLDGTSVSDGQQFRVVDQNGVSAVYEYESGFSIQVPQTLAITVPPVGAATGGVIDGQTFKVGFNGSEVTFELDSNNNTVLGNTPIGIAVGDTATQVRDKILAVLLANTTLNLAPKAVGTDSIHLGSLPAHTLDISNSKLIPSGVSAGVQDGQSFSFTQDGVTRVFEFNTVGDTNIGSGNIEIPFARTMTNSDIAAAIVTTLGAQSFDLPLLQNLGNGLVHLGGRLGQQLSTTSSVLQALGSPGVTKSLELLVPSMSGPGAIQDGETFTITRGTQTITFEFNSNANTTPGNTVINFSSAMTADQVAIQIANVIRGTTLGLNTAQALGAVVKLNEGIGYTINTGTSRLLQSGVSGGATPIVYTPWAKFTAVDMAGVIINAINGTSFAAKARSRGSETIFLSGASVVTDIANVRIQGITDIAGNPLAPNRSNQETQFTILLPGVQLDYSDAPDPGYSTILDNNGARHVVLANNQLLLGSVITTETDGTPAVDAVGDGGDDGVTFAGVFNENSNPVVVTIEASRSGLIDAWVDWNRDGDWNDPGEQYMNTVPVRPGFNNFNLVTPVGASIGNTFARFRISSAGGLSPTGVGMDGEVEDYMINVLPGTPPVGTADQYAVLEDGSLTTTQTTESDTSLNNNGVLVNDNAGTPAGVLSAVLISGPTKGSLTLNPNGNFTYTPQGEYFGNDSFVYRVVSSNGLLANQNTTVNITVVPRNDTPTAVDLTYSAGQGSSVTVPLADLLAGSTVGPINESAAPPAGQGQILSIHPVTPVGSATPVGSTVSYNPATGLVTFNPDSPATTQGTFVYTLIDNGKDGVMVDNAQTGEVDAFNTVTRTVTINFIPVNDPPTFTAGPNVTVNEDSGAYSQPWASNILPGPAGDPGEVGQIVTFNVTVAPADQALFANGALPSISSSGILTFTPANNANGVAVVSVVAQDDGSNVAPNRNSSDPVLLTITISAVNDNPVASNSFTYSITEDTLLSVNAPGLLTLATDPDLPNDTLNAVAANVTSVRGAPVIINANGSFSYDPRAVQQLQALSNGQSLQDSFVYRVRDAANALSNEATVQITVNGVNDAPVAVNDPDSGRFVIPAGGSRVLTVLSNDRDVDNAINPASVSLEILPSSGTAIVNTDGTVTYRPSAGFRGTDSFTYRVSDILGAVSNEATVSILVNDAPTARGDQTFTNRNVPININVLSNDSDPDGTLDPASVTIVTPPPSSQGSVQVLADGQIRFTPATDFTGEATFSYTVRDNVGTTSNVAQVRVNVLSSAWQNPSNRFDVNADTFISAIDALIVINAINRNGGSFPLIPGVSAPPPPFMDVDGNNVVNSQDALNVINALNQRPSGEGEGSAEGEGSDDVSLSYLAGGWITQASTQFVNANAMVSAVGNSILREAQAELDSVLFSSARRAATVPATSSYPTGRLADLFASDMDEMYELLAADMEDEEQAADYLLTDIDSLLN
jgi:VCBS repeat-containing protein